MSKKLFKQKQRKKFFGNYLLDGEQSFVGECRIKGPRTALRLHSSRPFSTISTTIPCIHGHSYSGEYLTLIDCNTSNPSHSSVGYYADFYPHYVLVGNSHFKPDQSLITSIQFSTQDLTTIFYDCETFSHVIDSKSIIDTVLQERRQRHSVEAGEFPEVYYFTGKYTVIEVLTAIGTVSVRHHPRFSPGGPSGISVKNRMLVMIEPNKPIDLDSAFDLMRGVTCFLSIAAGRAQEIRDLHVNSTEKQKGVPAIFTVHQSYHWKSGRKRLLYNRPHPSDLPLNPIYRPEEFSTVLSNWVSMHKDWSVSRFSHLACTKKENKYNADRLVSAANLFDTLPKSAVPASVSLCQELTDAKIKCRAIFKELPSGEERDSMLLALGRLGKPSLNQKIAYRIRTIEPQLGVFFPELRAVAAIAVKYRNFFVHGSQQGLNVNKLESFLPFLTDTLEFIFSASDMIEAGWDAQQWSSRHLGRGHSFSRFLREYPLVFPALLDD